MATFLIRTEVLDEQGFDKLTQIEPEYMAQM